MRPERLELSGFAAFREPTVVDFSASELFVLTGPTGSGKSTLIDAMVFALYGSVPRYDDKRAVVPVISLGKLEARVRFDFSVAGESWTAVRVVRRAGAGATTAEARLEHGAEVVAGTADEVTEHVERLLGLEFDHFTKSVVLPQGDFQRFLHDRPSQRQALLRSLLDVAIYGRIRELATRRSAAAEEAAKAASARLAELEAATSERLEAAEERAAQLERLYDRITEAEPKLEELTREAFALEQEAELARDQSNLLSKVEAPDDLEQLATAHTSADKRQAQAEHGAARASADLAEAEEKLAALPEAAELVAAEEAHLRLSETRTALDELVPQLECAKKELIAARSTQTMAAQEAAAAEEHQRAARRAHAAHDLRASLEPGEACPVCGQLVEEVPTGGRAPALDEAEQAVSTARHAQDASLGALSETERAHSKLEARTEDLSGSISRMEEKTAAMRPSAEVQSLRSQLDAVGERRDRAKETSALTQRELLDARHHLEEVNSAIAEARRAFDRARDRVAKLSPPAPERQDLAADWAQLLAWTGERSRGMADRANDASRQAEARRQEESELSKELDSWLGDHGLAARKDMSREKVSFEALAGARQDLDRIQEALQEASKTKGLLSKLEASHAVADSLAVHLRADRFEGWLLDEALSVLVAGANDLLADLSQNAYSLRLERRRFQVIDHRNADDRRSVKTLSGGETFLVSLALALSLAEQLAAMSSRGGARIESIFLDEGFGTLDRETLEVVASVIHELGASGRTVGLVTHVSELAEQVPVRFEVRKGPLTATVERVDV